MMLLPVLLLLTMTNEPFTSAASHSLTDRGLACGPKGIPSLARLLARGLSENCQTYLPSYRSRPISPTTTAVRCVCKTIKYLRHRHARTHADDDVSGHLALARALVRKN
uniref:Putative secreted protein n=1 Tax=Anopheles marajoara TaxID=58244 RepID=A0A2M4C831_9DIPT